MDPYQRGHNGEGFLCLGDLLGHRQQQLGYQRAPDLCINGVFVLSVEVMQLEVLLHLLEQYLYAPSFFVKESHVFGRYVKIVRQKLKVTVLFVLVTDLSQFYLKLGFRILRAIFSLGMVFKLYDLVP